MQVHLYEKCHSDSLARHYATHNLNLHMLVLSDLRSTYWTADLQYNLFSDALKVTDHSTRSAHPSGTATPTSTSNGPMKPCRVTAVQAEANNNENHANAAHATQYADVAGMEGVGVHPMDNFFMEFNPFMGVQLDLDPT